MIPMLTLKATPILAGNKCDRKWTVTDEILHMKKDTWGELYPVMSTSYITVSKSASLSGDLMLDYLDKVFFPEVGAQDGKLICPTGLVLDASSGHFDEKNQDSDWTQGESWLAPHGW